MILRDITFPSPQENIVFDEVLLSLAEHSLPQECLRFWESPQTFVVLGRTSSFLEDVYLKNTKKDKIPVLRRCSGGGTVLQGKGCLSYSLILLKSLHPQIQDLRESYRFILGRIIQALEDIGVRAVYRPISDLALSGDEKKISGNAQKRGKRGILHHGTLLYDFDITLAERYLKMPQNIPEYRRERPHKNFLTNVRASSHQLKGAIAKSFKADAANPALDSREESLMNQFLAEKEVLVG